MENLNQREWFQSEALKALVGEFLGFLALEPSVALSELTPGQLERYKAKAKTALENPVLQSEVSRLIEEYQKILARQANTDLERAYYRGAILAFETLLKRLQSLAPGKTVTYTSTSSSL